MQELLRLLLSFPHLPLIQLVERSHGLECFLSLDKQINQQAVGGQGLGWRGSSMCFLLSQGILRGPSGSFSEEMDMLLEG